jgi:predicted dehydrogenase
VHCSVHWDHNWVQGTEFDHVRHLILYDFAIHWFDMLTCLMAAQRPLRVTASLARPDWQLAQPALLGQCLVEYPHGQASLVFDGTARYGHHDRTYLAGSLGTLVSEGVDCKHQQVTLATAQGIARPKLQGVWFPDGFHGTMGELLRAIEEDREPENSARGNLDSLALCFAAVHSAERHQPVVPGEVRAMPGDS